ncbi:MAG: glycosyltransferase family 9 protein [Candidatus Omnitrophica bacterium]|nr:glycosyltransferase family 9 protein [Candidatus Omnitrophota bacterium]
MRILQLVPQMNVGGVETGTLDLARGLARRGHECYVISAGGALVGELIKAGARHVTMPIHKKSIFSLALVDDVAQLIEREQIDIVHARSRVPAWIGYFAARRTGRPFVTTCHGYYSTHFLSRVMGYGKQVIAISNVIGRHMIEDFNVPPERITLIHRGVDLVRFPFIPDKYDRPPKDKLIVASVGRITSIKGFYYFISAIRLALKELPKIEAWIIGSPKKENDAHYLRLRGLVEKWNLGDKIKFLGSREDIPELVKTADLVVVASIIPEGFGRTVIEAGAVGTAVVATEVGGLREIIENNVHGLLVSPEDENSMCKAITTLLLDRKRSKKMAQELRKRTEKEFSLDLMVDKTCSVYEEVKERKRILFLKLGAVGDIILAIPSLRMIRKRFPSASITLCVDPKFLPLVMPCPYVDEVITFDRRRGKRLLRLLQLARYVRRKVFDVSIDFQNTTWTHLLAFFGNVPARYGYERHWTGFLLNRGEKSFHDKLPPVEHQFRILKRLGISDYDDRLEIWAREKDDEKVKVLLDSSWVVPGQKLVGIVLGSSRRWFTKRWPVEYFAELAKRLSSSFQMRAVLIGHVSETSLVTEFMKHFSNGVIDCVGRTSISELVSLVKRLDVLVCGDTAPLHIAAALGKPTVALFGPTDPARHAPPHLRGVCLYEKLPCAPCYKEACPTMECLKKITVDDVFKSVKNMMRRYESTTAYHTS